MVVGDGFEPSKHSAADLQSAPFGRSGIPPNGASKGSRTPVTSLEGWCTTVMPYSQISCSLHEIQKILYIYKISSSFSAKRGKNIKKQKTELHRFKIKFKLLYYLLPQICARSSAG